MHLPTLPRHFNAWRQSMSPFRLSNQSPGRGQFDRIEVNLLVGVRREGEKARTLHGVELKCRLVHGEDSSKIENASSEVTLEWYDLSNIDVEGISTARQTT
ncbi:hypothetical protein [Luethyella okanaganae]|uniref:Uncharacterized protein n=1 Tax=Luethyella okanaganae TaxID=69372 RepID=A0ABW1VJJ1_9MICO